MVSLKRLRGRACGAPERIRTSGLCLRRAALYPAELRVPDLFINRETDSLQLLKTLIDKNQLSANRLQQYWGKMRCDL